ncbi:aspartate aminotransferase family protein [Agrobacterium rhizogenes]|uniref:4-aminobutyrate aminotransferase n=1 Tax=Rhizobium rhizogenes (strain K84 / ATCC BAA-868) TaxID=311403 RepID=B9JQD6_RHIR8|nr:aspartate aminotransferase family protein [Rhizobium rhizogenes]ACM31355.1 4-aminobutyrate aminotransferase [Rhizobium rhizogenes K84]NTI46303.1 aspartate aminotransferase family protein [Rhizobium rhizogenes]NTI52986.1 aspartate aminotransferase family protein [Rhizobium rhizogenes]NTI98359.1 aspartate aminotransferase family protein [Rhizobium rhizogenes]NTJ60788.1 aspartate aminotransferase family protein [Rhizobium rhizogenes]
MVNGFDPANLGKLDAKTRDIVERRAKFLGPAYRLMYAHPVEIARGSGSKLYDSAGNDYLDAYNNVPSVGHSHPKVVEAIHRQLETLCTHTRYLQDGILEYAASILPTFEDNIEHIMFTCTGSEANDLALRLACHHTGRNGVIITSEAYHGNSFMTAGFSPSLGPKSPLGTWVRRIPTPDSYRIAPQEMGAWLAGEVQKQIDDLEGHGDGLAAFYADSLFSSDGIYADPVGLLAPIAEVVRRAGGLFIADEVQAGFGRSGDRFWGYQRHGVTPDIVTMGKPMGNGYPVAAIALAPRFVEKFGSDMRYFNTFGGNTVAIAAAQATLDVMREEKLQSNAKEVGAIVRDGLRDLATRYEAIGDIRGAGLYIGVEFVKDRTTKIPDSATALAVTNGLRERRVLISATGFHANTLKIRPPLVFSRADAARLLTELEATLAEVCGHR